MQSCKEAASFGSCSPSKRLRLPSWENLPIDVQEEIECLYEFVPEVCEHFIVLNKIGEGRDNLDTDCLKALHCADNAKYMSNRFVEEVVTTTGRVLADGQHKEILASPFYSIMLDETTDVDVKKELIIYIRYLRNGTSMTCFNRMLELKDGKAETITDAVINLLHSHQLPLQNLCGLGSDGASVMIGHRGGVSALLKQQVPHLISNHCVAHRLALASSQSANQIPYLKKFKAIVEQLYRFYNYSPVRTAALKEIQAVLNDPVIKITQAKDVRWLSHDRAVQSIRLCLESVVTSLEREAQERSDVQAMGLSVFIQTYEFIAALMMMSDVLPILTRLSKAMQKRDLDYSFISPLVTAARSSIAALKDSPGEHFASLQQKMEDLVEKPFRFKSPSESAVASFKKNIYDKFLGNIEENLVKRFPNIPLLEAFSVFQFQDMEEDMNYGTEQIKLLCQHFRLEEEAGLLEWSAVVAMAKADEHFRTKPASEVMGKLTGQQEAFPILAKLCCAGLLIPTSTAGTFSSVFLAKLRHYPDMKQLFALKHIIPTSHPSRIEGELKCLQEIGGCDNVMGVELCIRNRDHVVIVMPYFPHEKFQDYIQTMSVSEVREYMRNLLLALRRVHQFDIIHRDIKPSNFLYDRRTKQYALVDFGLAHKVPSSQNQSCEASSSHRTALTTQSNTQNLPHSQTFTSPEISKQEPQKSRQFTPPTPDLSNKVFTKKVKSPRRLLLAKRALMVKEARQSGSHINLSTCQCFGQPTVCSICTARGNQQAPRAGTPGFRSPEVLLKCPDQTTAVDIWSAGVIFLSLLSSRYPFFRANDDLTALAQIISIMGSDQVKESAKCYGKNLLCSPTTPALDMRTLCMKLRSGVRSVRSREDKENSISWSQIPSSAFDLLHRLLDLNPATRITADEAIKHSFFSGM